MSVRRPRLLTRKARRHGLTPPSQFENPAKNWEFIRHIHSPWALIALMLFQIVLLVLIMVLFGYQRDFSDYLHQRGQFADRQRTEERTAVCDLISELRADPAGQLEALSKRLGCPKGPLPLADAPSESATPVPIAPTGTYSTETPTPGSRTPTGDATGPLAGGNRPLGTNVPAPPSGQSRTTDRTRATVSEPPPSTESTAPGGGSPSPTPPLPDPTPPQLCVPFTALCLGL